MKKKVKYVSVYHYCQGQDAEYRVSFNRGGDASDDPKYNNPTKASLKRLANQFFWLENPQPTFQSNYVNLQAYTKGD